MRWQNSAEYRINANSLSKAPRRRVENQLSPCDESGRTGWPFSLCTPCMTFNGQNGSIYVMDDVLFNDETPTMTFNGKSRRVNVINDVQLTHTTLSYCLVYCLDSRLDNMTYSPRIAREEHP